MTDRLFSTLTNGCNPLYISWFLAGFYPGQCCRLVVFTPDTRGWAYPGHPVTPDGRVRYQEFTV